VNTKHFLEQILSKKQLSNLQEISNLAQEVVSLFLHAGRLENVLTGFKENIIKFQVCPILS